MSGSLALLAGVVCVLATIYALIKRIETRLVLFISGLVMSTLALQPLAALDAFAGRMVTASLLQAICSVMGFAYVMKHTKCDAQLVNLFTGFLGKIGILIIPAAVLITFAINIPLTSAAGCAAAAGAILVPLLMSNGVHPATAAATVAMGTYGSILAPGNSHNIFLSNLADMDLMSIIGYHAPYSVTVGVLGAITMTLVAFVTKTHKGYVYEGTQTENGEKPSANLFMAVAPIIPIVLLIGSSNGWFGDVTIGVAQAMLVGTMYAVLVTRANPAEMTRNFFDGMGSAYGNVIGIIIAAAVFVAGLNSLGMIDSAINALIEMPSIAKFGGTLGPMALAIITGSADAAAFAFNETVTPSAELLGMNMVALGSAAQIAGSLGRTMSPLAGNLIVLAGMANVDTMQIAKKTAIPAIVNVLFLIFFFL